MGRGEILFTFTEEFLVSAFLNDVGLSLETWFVEIPVFHG